MENNKNRNRVFSIFINLFEKIKKKGSLKKIIILVLVVLVVLIFLPNFSFKKSSSTKSETIEKVYVNCSALEYCKTLENKLENVLSSVKGLSNVKVYLTITEGPKTEYLKETNITESSENGKTTVVTEENIYTQKNGSNSEPVEVRQILPKIESVLIVAKGADMKMQIAIANIVSSVLSVSVSKVEVMEGK